jgi:hypothetical protein
MLKGKAGHAGLSVPPDHGDESYETLKARAYADEMIRLAKNEGIDNVSATWKSIRRVKAAKRGEIFAPDEPYLFNMHWR